MAREALGTDEGISFGESTDEALLNSPNADTLENLLVPESSANVFAATHRDAASSAEPTVATNPTTPSLPEQGSTDSAPAPSDANPEADEFLREEEVTATNEGMPSGILDEEPPAPNAKSTTAGE